METTFSNRAYIEGKLNITEQPDWSKFRIAGVGRRLMDYDADGNELGIITGKVNLRNIGLQIDRKSTRLNSSHSAKSRMPSSA